MNNSESNEADRLKSLCQRHLQNLKDIETARRAVKIAQDSLAKAHIALGRTLALLDLIELGEEWP